ncbi:3,4-dihydroxy-2-butanone-4-phosphate synthase [Ammoniphilus resinae]|uniref:3,4-dihydroxy-2-butanone-4-phosphate synthase n=1 Tax=Ammoniphilus resinae TaxID=861532 RepID=A0ABS4GSP2_9BACL|nr:3,4-dihydroxy-2-butanone-4-phosphate synthase [Ammoniphilus resinae]MBP1933286.1 3,4-dihydroxy 2-butanone 4-phosphate synthase/GTP cyclohydrolase II [Ammoniphilus resinae]
MGYLKENQDLGLNRNNLLIIFDDVHSQVGYAMGFGQDVKTEHVNFMIKNCRGLVYVCISKERALQLKLPLMVVEGRSNPPVKNFAISVDYKNSTTGISAIERVETIKAFTNPNTKSNDFKKPGHIFPLISQENDLQEYHGITEAAVFLSRLITNDPTSYFCEILNASGDVADLEEIQKFAKDHGMKLLKVSGILENMYRDPKWLEIVDRSVIRVSNQGVEVFEVLNHLYQTHHAIYLKMGSTSTKGVIFYDECQLGDLLGLKMNCKCNKHFIDFMKELVNGRLDCIVYQRHSKNLFKSKTDTNFVKNQVYEFILQLRKSEYGRIKEMKAPLTTII